MTRIVGIAAVSVVVLAQISVLHTNCFFFLVEYTFEKQEMDWHIKSQLLANFYVPTVFFIHIS